MPLATLDDVAARLGRLITDEEKPKVTAFLEDASAFVADYCTGTWDTADPPAAFKAVVCAEVIRWLAVSPGVVSEKVGDIEVEFGAASAAQALSPAAMASLRRYRRKVGSLTLRRM
ncbi:hypothetical protein [Streptomyces noursei]|uniref:hypothetical protein n=1 Tax=Streptomyces noursei TaxID=1971 RepID=UPI00167B8B6F|nr:hypothetical protein [Streptomyces noursei]MCZ1015607.1 hypothetical protein [Streptomyces noursei]GGW89432.1 hypothetical protein GCM10010341_07800 [Streptomyces noursei]